MAARLVQAKMARMKMYGVHRARAVRFLARRKVHGMVRLVGTGTMARSHKLHLAVMRSVLVVALVIVAFGACAASPCDGVDRSLTTERSVALAPGIAKQLHVPTVDVLQSFRFAGWSIIYVGTHQADEAFLFYAHDPLKQHYVALWSGGARMDEEQVIKIWVVKNAPGIPSKLAGCFAWHVTKDRDM
jgi:hypothetical protein